MIHPNPAPWESDVWRRELAQAFKDPAQLLKYLGTQVPQATTASPFPTLVPEPFAQRMERGNPYDPLLLQVLPLATELAEVSGFVADPLGETDPALGFTKTPGLIHKYHGRALLITTPGCAVNCRYCFRRDFPYAEHRPSQLPNALDQVRCDPSIEELILSGGDPLLLTDGKLKELVEQIAAIEHISTLRIHTRLPIVLPNRITDSLIELLATARLHVVVVLHTNHVNEIDGNVTAAVGRLRAAQFHVLNQTVLLKAVNDQWQSQVALARGLFEIGILPYYLHLPDQVAGTHHFYVSTATGQNIHQQMRARLPGYLVPRLVREVPGAAAKELIHSL